MENLDKQWQQLEEEIADCRACGLCEGRKRVVPGEGNRETRVLFVGEGPGAEEDRQGRPFVGPAGQLLDRMLDAVGLLQAINQMPSELSGGQRKRIGIARTLILQPEIVLYDEPTAGLDPITSIDINELINEVQQRFHTSAIIITHDLTCAKMTGDRIVMLLDGKFERQGSFEEVFDTDDERVKAFYNYNFIQ